MKYFYLILFFSVVNIITAQNDWYADVLAKYDFSSPHVSGQNYKLWEDEFGGNIPLYIYNGFFSDEHGPTGALNAVGLTALEGPGFIQINPGIEEDWATVTQFTVSFSVLDASLDNTGLKPLISFMDENDQHFILYLEDMRLYFEYYDGNNNTPTTQTILFPEVDETTSLYWFMTSLVVDTEQNSIQVLLEGETLIDFTAPMNAWQDLLVFFGHDDKGTLIDGLFCYSDIYLHQRTFTEEDSEYYAEVVKQLVDTRTSILHDAPIQVFPNLLSNQSQVQIVNPENIPFEGQVVDESGRLIQRFNQQRNVLQLGNLPSGSYRLHFVTKDGIVVRSVVKI